MNQLAAIQNVLKQLKPGLVSKYHISSLGLFGSVVRTDFTNSSDIDIIVDFSQTPGIAFIDLANELESRLHRKVDLVSKKGIKPSYLSKIEQEIIYV